MVPPPLEKTVKVPPPDRATEYVELEDRTAPTALLALGRIARTVMVETPGEDGLRQSVGARIAYSDWRSRAMIPYKRTSASLRFLNGANGFLA